MDPKYSKASIAVENPIFISASCFGLCSKCEHAHILAREKDHLGFCTFHVFEFPLPLDSKNPVQNCYNFSPRGQLSLYDMKQIATIIDVSKRKAGFGPDIFEVIIIPPKEDNE